MYFLCTFFQTRKKNFQNYPVLCSKAMDILFRGPDAAMSEHTLYFHNRYIVSIDSTVTLGEIAGDEKNIFIANTFS